MSVGRNKNNNSFRLRNLQILLSLTGLVLLLSACVNKQAGNGEQESPVVIEIETTGAIVVEEENEIVVEAFVVDPATDVADADADTTIVAEPAPSARMQPSGDVKWMQQRLKDLGYYEGPIDGRAGGATRRAIKSYQLDQGVDQDGDPTKELQDFMWRNGG